MKIKSIIRNFTFFKPLSVALKEYVVTSYGIFNGNFNENVFKRLLKDTKKVKNSMHTT